MGTLPTFLALLARMKFLKIHYRLEPGLFVHHDSVTSFTPSRIQSRPNPNRLKLRQLCEFLREGKVYISLGFSMQDFSNLSEAISNTDQTRILTRSISFISYAVCAI